MVRFRALSVSSTTSSVSQVDVNLPPSQAIAQGNSESARAESSNSRKQEITSKRRRSGIDKEKLREVNMAKKKEAIRRRIKARGFNHVYVGNITPTITESTLYDTFKVCGKITGIEIRCSRGSAVNIGRPVAPHILTGRDLQYATIEFADQNSVRNALTFTGRRIHGVPVVVTVCAVELPEVEDVVVRRMKAVQGQRFPAPSLRPRLQREKTEPIIGLVSAPEAPSHGRLIP